MLVFIAPGMASMIALSTISITAMEAVSDAKARRMARLQGMPAPPQGQHAEQVAEEESQADGERNRRGVVHAEFGTDDHAQDFADAAAGEAMQRRVQGQPVQRSAVDD